MDAIFCPSMVNVMLSVPVVTVWHSYSMPHALIYSMMISFLKCLVNRTFCDMEIADSGIEPLSTAQEAVMLPLHSSAIKKEPAQ